MEDDSIDAPGTVETSDFLRGEAAPRGVSPCSKEVE
jgi:hypothetical protein